MLGFQRLDRAVPFLLLATLQILFIDTGDVTYGQTEHIHSNEIQFNRVHHEFRLLCDSVNASFRVTYTVFESPLTPSVTDSLNCVVAQFVHDDSTHKTLTADSSDFLFAAKAFLGDCSHHPSNHEPWGYHLNRFVIVVHDTADILSVLFGYDQLGGVHPVTYGYLKNYSRLTGSLIILDSLLVDGKRREFDRRAEPFFRQRYKIPADAPMDARGFYFGADSFFVNDNYSVVDSGLQFNLNPYEDCSYIDQGSYVVPFGAFIDLIRDDGSLSYALIKSR